MSLNFRQLQIVRAVSRHGSVTAAASALGISQPAVSMMLRDCARSAGFPLFLRKQGRLQPTMETSVLVGDLDRVFNGIDRVNRLLEDMRDIKVGTIQIAATPTLADNLLPRAVAAFQRERPNVQITISTMDNISVVDHVLQEHVDFGLVLSPMAHFDTRPVKLCAAELICVVHREHALARLASVTPEQIAPFPLISFSRSLPLGMLIDQTFRDAGVARRIALEVNQSSVACALARAGAGVAIIDPFWFLDQGKPELVRLQLRPRTEITAQALVPKDAVLSRPARLLLTTIRNTASQLKRSGAF
jgi:DNA-binding transcriptional LysR family regulator